MSRPCRPTVRLCLVRMHATGDFPLNLAFQPIRPRVWWSARGFPTATARAPALPSRYAHALRRALCRLAGRLTAWLCLLAAQSATGNLPWKPTFAASSSISYASWDANAAAWWFGYGWFTTPNFGLSVEA